MDLSLDPGLRHRPLARPARLLAWLLLLTAPVGAETRLLRFPDLHGDRVVFCYAGDLWLASAGGGDATRLTTHDGLELFPRFSPDGAWIAFTGQYDGDEQVYFMPSAGGVPRQLTWYPARGPLPPRWGYDNQVYGWTPDGTRVLFRSMRHGWNNTDCRLYTVRLEGGLPTPLPMPVSGAGDLSPDGARVVYSPLVRDFRTWKRYQGGWAQDLWIFDIEKLTARQITSHPRTERDPMWIGSRIYYCSDADGTLNLYSFDLESGETQQVTHSHPWDVRWPAAADDERIVYELQGRLQVLDLRTGVSRSLAIRVPDDGVTGRPSRVSASDRIESVGLAPGGRRAVFVARGDVFSVPVEKGPTRNLTRSSDAHDKSAVWSPDGRWIAYLSDATGEDELWIVPQDGSGPPVRLTEGGTEMRYRPVWSPDSESIAFTDKSGRLWVLEVETRSQRLVADDPSGAVFDAAWSPDGAHLAFSLSSPTGHRSLWIWSRGEDAPRRVTGPLWSEYGPAWDPSGEYLFYLSDREFAPQLAHFEWNYAVNRETGIFALVLRADGEHPFPPLSDEVELEEQESEEDGDGDGDGRSPDGKEPDGKEPGGKEPDGKEPEAGPAGEGSQGRGTSEPGAADERAGSPPAQDAPKPVRIDFEGLSDRVARVPMSAENYASGSLIVTEERLLCIRGEAGFYGRSPQRKPELVAFSRKERKETVIASDVGGCELGPDGEHLLLRQGSAYKVLPVSAGPGAESVTIPTAALQVDRIPADEWEQIFDEVWRRFRDFFYVSNMHGYDWEALRDRYRPLLRHVSHRADLNYVIGEMIAELNVSHAYIAGGDYEIPRRAGVALLGAVLELDEASGRYRIARILRGHNEEERYRAPLTGVGLDVSEGDFILAIDGDDLRYPENPYRLLRHRASHPISLTVNERPDPEGARRVSVRPISSEKSLNYLAWVLKNRELVERASGGRVGYLHVPDMGADGIREFIKWFYGQVRKEGLIVDVRYNGGGNVSQMLIERLRRTPLSVGFSRNRDHPATYPSVCLHGHMACVLNENSASDGDIFPYMFRKAGLGPLIGKRSWGGVIGITNRGPLIDGGSVFVPEFGMNEVDGRWVVEGHGVDPDIEVDNPPKAVIEGRDPQLERAVEEVLRRIEAEPRRLPGRPADPVRTE